MKRASFVFALLLLTCQVLADTLPSVLSGTVTLKANTDYYVTSRTTISADNTRITVAGGGRCRILGTIASGDLFNVVANYVTFENVDFENGGVYRDGRKHHLSFLNCGFKNIFSGLHRAAITSYVSTFLLIERCTFDNVAYACWVADETDVTTRHNEVKNSGYGFKVFGDGANTRWLSEYNYIHDCGPDFMAHEWQGRSDDYTIRYNLVERIRVGAERTQNDHTLVNSVPMARSQGKGLIEFNVLIGKDGLPSNSQSWIPMAWEMGGGVKGDPNREVLARFNYIVGVNNAFDVTDGDGTSRTHYLNNYTDRVNKTVGWNNRYDPTTNPNGTQEVILEGKNGKDAPPPSGFASWDLFVADLRMKVGPKGAGVSTPPPATLPASETEQLKALVADLTLKVNQLTADNNTLKLTATQLTQQKNDIQLLLNNAVAKFPIIKAQADEIQIRVNNIKAQTN